VIAVLGRPSLFFVLQIEISPLKIQVPTGGGQGFAGNGLKRIKSQRKEPLLSLLGHPSPPFPSLFPSIFLLPFPPASEENERERKGKREEEKRREGEKERRKTKKNN